MIHRPTLPSPFHLAGMALALMLAGCAHTESRTGPPQRKPPGASTTTYEEARRQAVDIGMQPARDVGLSKHEIPPVLESALADPLEQLEAAPARRWRRFVDCTLSGDFGFFVDQRAVEGGDRRDDSEVADQALFAVRQPAPLVVADVRAVAVGD